MDDLESAESRYRLYVRHTLAQEKEPMYWGDWIAAGQPVPDEGDRW